MGSPQTLSESDRRSVAAWAADCAERVLWLFEAEAPHDRRPRDAIARTRAFARGELDAAGEIRRRFVGGGAAGMAQAIRWQLSHMSAAVNAALRVLPPVGADSAGPLGPGLLASGLQGMVIRDLQAGLATPHKGGSDVGYQPNRPGT